MDAQIIRKRLRKQWLDEQRRKHGQMPINDNVDGPFLGVYGYNAKIYRLEHACSQSDLELDRYDVRHFDQISSSSEATLADSELHSIRFAELESAHVSELRVFEMSGEERRMYIESIGRHAPKDATFLSSESKPNEFILPVHVPDSMPAPRTRRQFEIIEHTARFIADQPIDRAPRMELTIQGKQGTSADFEFLNQTSVLYPFYTHIVWLMRTNLYAYTESSSESEQDEAPVLPSGSEPLAAPLDEKAKRRLRAFYEVEFAASYTHFCEYLESDTMSENVPTFSSPQEEIAFWREVAMDARTQLEDKDIELAEHQLQSSELEAELEQEIRHLEKANTDLRTKNERLKYELEELKRKYHAVELKSGKELESIERELHYVRSQQELYQSRTRELEQDNDDLERERRAANSTMRSMELRLSQAQETNSKMLGEVEAKKLLADEVQRLKDEVRDMNLELNIARSRSSRGPQPGLSKSSANVDSGDNPSRVVHDIMNRVKDLESRLAGARNKVTPLIGDSGQYATLRSRVTRNRTVSTPKAASLFASGSSAMSGAETMMRRPTNPTSTRPPINESRIPTSSLLESRRERSRILRESFRKGVDEVPRQQTVPQQR
ncbi:NADH:ubiquinone oxidoreductase [Coemansia sp. RSA 1853]|nr:NADH:ubiquinone oxidoreductase [Coemansia sp. RSA 1853]